MSETFYPNRKSSRIQNWNYGWEGLYFVTINTRFGENYFGDITNESMNLNTLGKEVERQWLLSPSLRPDMNLELDEFIVMPNHFHGIIGIGRNEYNAFPESCCTDATHGISDSHCCTDAMHGVRTADNLNAQNSFGPQRKNLGSIMRGFKSSVTTWARKNQVLFDWHSRYHDVIIRDEVVLNKIRKYIRNNPAKWENDRFWK